MSVSYPVGKLLSSGMSSCLFGCRLQQRHELALGDLVRIPQELPQPFDIFGLITDMKIDDDGLIRQMVNAENLPEEVLQDNRLNRNVPMEIQVHFCGYQDNRGIHHLLPPRPPISLDHIFTCSDEEICAFTRSERFGYFRHILHAKDLPIGEILARHLQKAAQCHANSDNQWVTRAARELITALRDDYPVLIDVLGALADANLPIEMSAQP